MGKSSKSITLALMGSALVLAGCSQEEEENQWQGENSVANQAQSTGGGARGGGVFIAPRIGGGGFSGVGGGGPATSGASARGGFGSSGSVGVSS